MTWHSVLLEKDKNIIDFKWVYKIKKNFDGSTIRYKARLGGKKIKQMYTIDENTFSLVI